jgi:hypothetical protein
MNWTRARQPDAFRSAGPVRFERSVPLSLGTDSHPIVVATGEDSRLGPAHGPYAQHRPTAVSNPNFVDVDGGGFAANRDTLGVPLPVFAASRGGTDEAD